MDNELHYQIALTLVNGLGPVNSKKLIAYCGGAKAVFETPKSKLLKIPSIGPIIINNLLDKQVLDNASNEIEFINKHRISSLYFLDENYPEKLSQCIDSPILLYYKGSIQPNQARIISVVGSRNATNYGKEICEQIIQDLKHYNPLIISGLAYGVDVSAHKYALQNNIKTIGVLAHGLDRIYPSAHKNIASEMLDSGGLLTEFMSNTNPDRENFPKRNRIVAGMSDCTIVIEASNKGGALITANLANDYSRDVFAVPGRLGDLNSEGCNRLIKTNKAHLVESADDVAYIMGWNKEEKAKTNQKSLFIDFTSDEELLVELLKTGDFAIDSISDKIGLNASKTLSLLFNLEMKGAVKSLPGKVYKLIN